MIYSNMGLTGVPALQQKLLAYQLDASWLNEMHSKLDRFHTYAGALATTLVRFPIRRYEPHSERASKSRCSISDYWLHKTIRFWLRTKYCYYKLLPLPDRKNTSIISVHSYYIINYESFRLPVVYTTAMTKDSRQDEGPITAYDFIFEEKILITRKRALQMIYEDHRLVSTVKCF